MKICTADLAICYRMAVTGDINFSIMDEQKKICSDMKCTACWEKSPGFFVGDMSKVAALFVVDPIELMKVNAGVR